MTVPDLPTAIQTLAGAIRKSPATEDKVRRRWRTARPSAEGLSMAVAQAADSVSAELCRMSQTDAGIAGARPLLAGTGGRIVVSWCSASASRRDVRVAPMLRCALTEPALRARVAAAAGDRILSGPLLDALRCAPLLGDGAVLAAAEMAQVRARLEILIWVAGATAREFPELGPWIWSSRSTFDAVVSRPAIGSLRGRVLAARCLEISACGMPVDLPPDLVELTLAVLQPLLLHPEPLVWVHAARALGRLFGRLNQLQGMLSDWVSSDSAVLRQRAIAALASVPSGQLGVLEQPLRAVVVSPDEENSWTLAAAAVATPYLLEDNYELWTQLADRIVSGVGGPLTAAALAQGLAALWRAGVTDVRVAEPLRALRDLAQAAPASSVDELRGWIEVIAITDVLDAAERDPLDLGRGLDNLVRVAAAYDDEEADARAARFAAALAPTIAETCRITLSSDRPRHRAAAMNALVSCTRAVALGLWSPPLQTHPTGRGIEAPDIALAQQAIVDMPEKILEIVRSRRRQTGADPHEDGSLEVLALTLGGYALDAGSDPTDPASRGAGPTADLTCRWLRKLDGLSDGSRTFSPELDRALSEVFWRLVDSTRGTARGVNHDDIEWLGPFAAWWALVIDRPAVLRRLANALPMVLDSALSFCCERAEVLRTAVCGAADNSAWDQEAQAALASLHAGQTELAHALGELANELRRFETAAGRQPEMDTLCVGLVLASDRLVSALADPVKALRPAAPEGQMPDSPTPDAAANESRIARLVARAIAVRDPSMLDVWLASLGPVVSAFVDSAIRRAIKRTPPPPPRAIRQPTVIEGYDLVKPLGEGGVGTIWLVRKPGADRLFVLKIPRTEALAVASEVERRGILSSFVEEAATLAGLYHPNLANIIDRGVAQDMPYLVLEYLVGADLKQYATARKMSLFELRAVVLDACAGLTELHGAGFVHRDIKPANLWLRLPLQGGEPFDPDTHRDPAVATPLATVIIDFGMVRASKVTAEFGGSFVAGTAGYIAPEQVLDPVELDPRADVYALAGTIYNVTTGRAFFDDIDNHRDRIVAHMRRDPFEEEDRLRTYPAEVARLLRAATAMNPADRPYPNAFAQAFVAAL